MTPDKLSVALVLAATTFAASAALAHPPEDLADLVGAKAGQSEGVLEARGYELTSGNNWWSQGETVCVHMVVSQGVFKEINIVAPKKCGKGGGGAAAGSGECPADVSQADRYKYPACN
jgi:hypothetical protein